MVTEQTQFSMAELHEFLKVEVDPGGAGCNKREKAMLAYSRTVTGRDLAPYGGEDNIQRVRVLADPNVPDSTRYEFVTKLPVAALADQKRKAEQAGRLVAQNEVLAVFRALMVVDPKKADQFLKTEGAKVLERRAIIALLEVSADIQKAAKKVVKNIAAAGKRVAATKRPIVQRVPKAKQDAYALALEQDRLNRIKASKEAAANLRKKAS